MRVSGKVFVVLSLVLGACDTVGPPGTVSYGLFFRPDDHIDNLLDREDVWAAAEVYDLEQAYFDERADRKPVQEAVARLEKSVRAEYAPLLSRTWPGTGVHDRANWAPLRDIYANIDDLHGRAARHRIVYEDGKYKALIDRTVSELRALRARFEAGGTDAFIASAWQPGRFFDEYPVRLNPGETIGAGWDALARQAAGKTFQENAGLWTRYRADLSDSQATFLAKILWKQSCGPRSFEDAVVQICRVNALAGEGVLEQVHLVSPVPVAFVSVLPGGVSVDWGNYRPLMRDASDLDALSVSGDLVVFLGSETGKEVDRRERANSSISSEYLAAIKTLPNPDYIAQQARVMKAQAEYLTANDENTVAQARKALCVDLCYRESSAASDAKYALERAARKLNREIDKLSDLSPTIEEPVYQEYEIIKTDYDITKTAGIDVVVYEGRDRITRFRPIMASDERSEVVFYNVHERDRQKPLYDKTEEDVEAYLEEDLVFQAAEILSRLPGAEVKSSRPGSLKTAFEMASARSVPGVAASPAGAAQTGWASGKFDTLMRSVVVVLVPNTSLAAGFFVGRDLVLTNHHAVEDARFVDIVLSDGTTTFGKVVRSSPHSDLALIKVNGAGVPVTFHSGRFGAGDDVIAIGHPNGLKFSVARGIVSSIRSGQVGMADSPLVKLVQTDTAINPGNSGGPLFLDGKVIGINTMGVRKDISEGLNFAVHIDEIRKFLNSSGT